MTKKFNYQIKFCSKCGAELNYTFKFSHYDVVDGEEIYTGTYCCPRKSFVFDGHMSGKMESWELPVMFGKSEIEEYLDE